MSDEERVAKYISREKDMGTTHLSVLDIVVALGISAEKIEKILDQYEKEGRIKEYIEPQDGKAIL